MRRAGVLAVLALAWLAVSAAPAWAHPFGPPPRAQLTAEGDTVTVVWNAADDDAVAVAAQVGLLPDAAEDAYLDGDPADLPTEDDIARVTAAPEVEEYVRTRVAVEQHGTACEPGRMETDNFVEAPTAVRFVCAEHVDEVDVRITLLHDRNDAYRTFGFAEHGDPELMVFSVETPEHAVRFDPEDAAAGSTAASGARVAVAAAGLALVGAGALGWRRLRS